jgi:flagellar hook protein FlgE
MSFQQGLSGLNSSSKQLDTIGNNVANSSTVGFKGSQAQFADMYAASLAGAGAVQVGAGSKVAAIVQQFTQGNITNTSNSMDTAISGKGFFRLVDTSGGVAYSRNGQFQLDKNGFIVNNQGHMITGYLPNAAGLIVQSSPVPLQISAADLVPKQSANSVVGVNLDALGTVPLTAVFDPTNPTSYNNSTSMTVYDSLGASHVATMYFQRQPILPTALSAGLNVGDGPVIPVAVDDVTGLSVGNTVTIVGAGAGGVDLTATITSIAPTGVAGVVPQTGNITFTPAAGTAVGGGVAVTSNAGSLNWNTFFTIDGASVPPSAPPLTPLSVLTFNTLGQLSSTNPVSAPVGTILSASFTPTSAAAQTMTFNFGQTTQYGGTFGVNTLTQDGYASGHLSGFNTSPDGTILGRYTNGQSRPMGQMVLANFTNPQGLQPTGNNEWVESSASGGPMVGVPGSGSLGVIQSGAVEDSNVDLTAELVNMITAQRVYQANAQTIKTEDQIMQTLVSLR